MGRRRGRDSQRYADRTRVDGLGWADLRAVDGMPTRTRVDGLGWADLRAVDGMPTRT